jgi:dephospho-CoA kinase
MSGKPVIGLGGGIGSGKSTVARELEALGCAVIDADRIGHDLLRDPDVKSELVRRFGQAILLGESGAVDRQALGRRVFANPEDLSRLNAVMHPRIRAEMVRRIGESSAQTAVKAIVLDAALLLETDWHDLCDVLVYVSAPDEQRAQRVAESRAWDQADWKSRENSQKPLDTKAAAADYIVENSSSLSRLRELVQSIFERILHAANFPKGRSL